MNANYFIKKLNLQPHTEGGYYSEVYRSDIIIPKNALPQEFNGERCFSTSIYFLVEKDNFSALHKIKSDEIWHFYYGDALEVIEIDDNGILKSTILGNNLEKNETFQYTVKANNWFGSRVKEGGQFSLVGCTVSPGFDFNDFELAKRNELILKFPNQKELIESMTRV